MNRRPLFLAGICSLLSLSFLKDRFVNAWRAIEGVGDADTEVDGSGEFPCWNSLDDVLTDNPSHHRYVVTLSL